jgi:hypothetical protein
MSERMVIRCYASYREAKRAVDCLRVARVPPRSITVFGAGLNWRAGLTPGRFTNLAVGGSAALAGSVALILWFFGALGPSFTWLSALAAGAALGAVLGVALALAAWSTRHSRNIAATGHVEVDRYEVLVDLEHAERARQLLA